MEIQKIYLELSDRCNLDCTICYRQSWKDMPMDLDGVIFSKLLDEIRQIPTLETVVIGGIGEPTCAPGFIRALDELGAYRLILTTNGINIEDEILCTIVERVDTVVLSVDGMDESFKRIRGVGLKSVTDTVKRLQGIKKERKSNRPSISLQCVLSEDNVCDALALVDLASELKVESLIFSNLMPQTADNRDKILYTRYSNPAMKELFNHLQVQSFRKGIKLVLPNYEIRTERWCSFIEGNATFISAEGDVIPCYRLSHNYLEFVFGREKQIRKKSFGNLKDQTLQEIWDSDDYLNYRQHVLNGRYPSCIDCDLVDGCEYVTDTTSDCWGNAPSCADCLWSRRIVTCP